MEWDEALQAFTYQCPCGDLFQITLEELASGERWLCVCVRGFSFFLHFSLLTH